MTLFYTWIVHMYSNSPCPSTSSSSSTCWPCSTVTRPCLLGSRVLAEPRDPLASYPNPAYRSSTRASRPTLTQSRICLPSSILTAPLGLLYSAVVPKGAFSIRDQHKPPNPLVSTLGSDWRRAQARWLNANHQAEASGQAPIL